MADGIDETEKKLFRETMQNIQPIKESHLKTITANNFPDHHEKIRDDLFFTNELPNIRSDEIIEFYRGGLQKRQQLKFKQGKFIIEATLDLHGYDRLTAQTCWQNFLMECQKDGLQHVLVIHGKGFRSQDIPILKNCVYLWLRADKNVIAFCSAKRAHGGTGAVYVRLKKTTR